METGTLPPKMDMYRRLKELEARLGFNSPKALARTKGARDTPELDELLTGLTDINARYVSYNVQRIRASEGVRRKTNELFDRLGPRLWPHPDEPHPPWLYLPSRDGDHRWAKSYPKQLSYSREEDRKILREHFYNLVCAKLYSYHNTNSRKVGNLANSQDLPNSQESEPPEDSASEIAYEDESDRDDESSTSNYSASPIFRSGDNAPRTRSHKEMPPFSAPTAPMLPKKQQMGNAQATLAKNSLDDPITSRATITGKANLEFNRNSPQSEPPSTTLPKQNITAANQFMSSSNLRSQGNRPTKRSVGTDAPETSSKRGRIEDVPSPHPPSLVVVLKLTREKKQFNGRTTGTDCNTSNQEERSTGSKPLQDIQSSRTGEGNHSASEPHDLPHSNLEGNTQQVPNSSNCQTQASVQTRSPSIPWTEYDVQQIDPPISDKPLSQQNTDQHEMHAAPEIRPDIAVAAGQHQIDEPIEKTSRQDGTGLQHRDAAQDPVAKGIQPPTVAEAGASTASPETDPLSQIWLTLFVPGNEDLNKADGLVTLTEMTSNEDLFRMMSEDLKGDLAAGDVITRVRLERRDGHALEGTDHTSVIIKKDGHRYTWPILASRMAESGAGRGGLNGSVTVKKEGDGK